MGARRTSTKASAHQALRAAAQRPKKLLLVYGLEMVTLLLCTLIVPKLKSLSLKAQLYMLMIIVGILLWMNVTISSASSTVLKNMLVSNVTPTALKPLGTGETCIYWYSPPLDSKHLQRYLNSCTFRLNRKKKQAMERVDDLLEHACFTRLNRFSLNTRCQMATEFTPAGSASQP